MFECGEMQILGAQILGMKYQNPNQHIQFQLFEAPNKASTNLGDERWYATPDQARTGESRKSVAHVEDQECQSKLMALPESLPKNQAHVTFLIFSILFHHYKHSFRTIHSKPHTILVQLVYSKNTRVEYVYLLSSVFSF